MKALCWHGKGDVRVDTVPDPRIEDPRDVIIRVTSTAICGSGHAIAVTAISGATVNVLSSSWYDVV